MTRLQLDAGRSQHPPKDVVGALTAGAGIAASSIGRSTSMTTSRSWRWNRKPPGRSSNVRPGLPYGVARFVSPSVALVQRQPGRDVRLASGHNLARSGREHGGGAESM
jgi:hypothetical protein